MAGAGGRAGAARLRLADRGRALRGGGGAARSGPEPDAGARLAALPHRPAAALRRPREGRRLPGGSRAGRPGGGRPALAAYALVDRGLLRCHAGDSRAGWPRWKRGDAALDALPPAQARADGRRLGCRRRAPLPRRAGAAERCRATAVPPCRPSNPRRGTLVDWLALAGRYGEALALGEAYLAAGGHRPQADADRAFLGWRCALRAWRCLRRPGPARQGAAGVRAGLATPTAPSDHHSWLGSPPVGRSHRRSRPALRAPTDRPSGAGWRRRRRGGCAGERRAGRGPPDPRFPTLGSLLLEGGWAEARDWRSPGRSSPTTATAGTRRPLLSACWRATRRDRAGLGAGARGAARRTGHRARRLPLPRMRVVLQRLAAELALDAGDLPRRASGWRRTTAGWPGAARARAGGGPAPLGALPPPGRRAGRGPRTRRGGAGPRHRAAPAAGPPRRPPPPRRAGHRGRAPRRRRARTWTTALALAEACAAPYERALTLLALAELRAATGQRRRGNRAARRGPRHLHAAGAPRRRWPGPTRWRRRSPTGVGRPPRRAERARGRGAAAGGGGQIQPRDRRGALHQPAHGDDPRHQHLRQARA